jgi:autotransporter-associated beta strand protein/T5SS/PEP-CTERM-associated repeat protein
MKSTFTVFRRCCVAALFLLLPLASSAQTSGFTGVFDPANWTFTSGGTPAYVAWNGSSSFTLTGSNAAAGSTAFSSYTTLLLTVSDYYLVSFDWSYTTGDAAPYDPAGYTSSDSNTQLTDNNGNAMAQSGTASNVYFGPGSDGFYIFSNDNQFGAASLTISNFSYTLTSAPPPPPEPSGTVTWTGATGNDWQNSANWTPSAPDATTVVAIANGSSPVLSGTDTRAEVFSLGITEGARLTVENGATLTSIGGFINDGGSLVLTGTGTSWTNTDSVFIGHSSGASFSILDGASASIAYIWSSVFDSSTSTILIDGPGSKLTTSGEDIIGYAGVSTLTVSNGGRYDAASITIGKYNPGRPAGITVTGAGSQLNTTGVLKLGEFGEGSLVISHGGVVTSGMGDVAYGSVGGAGITVGSATITGTGSSWNIGGLLGVGVYLDASNYNQASLTVADGGLVNVNNGSGTVRIGGGATIHIGVGGLSGTLSAASIQNGGTLSFDHTDDLVFGAAIGNYNDSPFSGVLVKSGAGTLTLTGANTYSGGTTINGGTLQLGNGGTTGSITGNVATSSGATLAFNRSNNLTFAGVISGAGNVAQTGSGVLTLSGTNTYSGGTRIDSGTLSVSSNANLGNASGGVTLAGGSLRLSNNTATSFDRAVTVTADSGVVSNRSSNGAGVTHTLGTLSIGANTLSVTRGSSATSGTGGITFGTTTLTGNATFNVGSNARLNLGAISGSYGFTKSGSGNLTLSGTHTYTGLTAIDAGTLALAAGASLANSSTIRVGSGATFDVAAVSGGFTLASGQTLGGSGSVNGLVTAASGSHLAPGSSPGTITFTGGLGLNASAFLDFELGTTSDKIRVSGGTLTGPVSGKITVNLSDSGGFTAGTYTLIDATGATLTSISATSFNLGTTIAGYGYTFSQAGNLFQLTATAVPEPAAFAALAGLGTLTLAAFRRRRAKLASSDPSA